jgi:hypothetical protein
MKSTGCTIDGDCIFGPAVASYDFLKLRYDRALSNEVRSQHLHDSINVFLGDILAPVWNHEF